MRESPSRLSPGISPGPRYARRSTLLAAGFLLIAFASFATAGEPRLVANTLTVARGETVTLSVSHLHAVDADTPSAGLTYSVSDSSGGAFEKVAAPGVPIADFSAAEVEAQTIRFVHDGSTTAPAYSVVVSDGTAASTALAASVTFVRDPALTRVYGYTLIRL